MSHEHKDYLHAHMRELRQVRVPQQLGKREISTQVLNGEGLALWQQITDNVETDNLFMSLDVMCDLTGMNKTNVKRRLAVFVQAGWLIPQGRKANGKYKAVNSYKVTLNLLGSEVTPSDMTIAGSEVTPFDGESHRESHRESSSRSHRESRFDETPIAALDWFDNPNLNPNPKLEGTTSTENTTTPAPHRPHCSQCNNQHRDTENYPNQSCTLIDGNYWPCIRCNGDGFESLTRVSKAVFPNLNDRVRP
jgi:hypothetical protein